MPVSRCSAKICQRRAGAVTTQCLLPDSSFLIACIGWRTKGRDENVLRMLQRVEAEYRSASNSKRMYMTAHVYSDGDGFNAWSGESWRTVS
jgi:hypothetical protein